MSRTKRILLGWVVLIVVAFGTALSMIISAAPIVCFIIGLSVGAILYIFLWTPINYCPFKRSFGKTKKAS